MCGTAFQVSKTHMYPYGW